MKKLLTALLMSITLIQLCWAAVGPYHEHASMAAQHTDHHVQPSKADAGAKQASGSCSSCEMQAGSLGYPTIHTLGFQRAATPPPASFTTFFSSHIPEHPEEPDWQAVLSHGVASRL